MIKIESTYSAFGNSYSPLINLQEVEVSQIDPEVNTFNDTFNQDDYLVVTVTKDKYKVTLLGGVSVYNALVGIKNSRTVTITHTIDNVEQFSYNAKITEIKDIDLDNEIIEFDFVNEDSKIIQNNQDPDYKNSTHTRIDFTLLDDIDSRSKDDVVSFYTNLPIISDVGEPNLISSTDTGEDILFHADTSRTKVTRLYLDETDRNTFEVLVYSSSIKLTEVTSAGDGTSYTKYSNITPIIESEEISNRIYGITLTITTDINSSNNIT